MTYIGGEFDIDMCAGSPVQEQFLITLQLASFRNIIRGFTRVTPSASTSLDLILTNDENKFHAARIAVDISDHLPIVALIQKESSPEHKLKARRQLISEKRLDEFKNRIALVNWSSVFQEARADDASDEFLRVFIPIYHECFPIVDIVPPKNARKPWMTARLIRQVKKKNKLFAKFLKSKEPQDLVRYKSVGNRLNK